jgi:hypothetical protein
VAGISGGAGDAGLRCRRNRRGWRKNRHAAWLKRERACTKAASKETPLRRSPLPQGEKEERAQSAPEVGASFAQNRVDGGPNLSAGGPCARIRAADRRFRIVDARRVFP